MGTCARGFCACAVAEAGLSCVSVVVMPSGGGAETSVLLALALLTPTDTDTDDRPFSSTLASPTLSFFAVDFSEGVLVEEEEDALSGWKARSSTERRSCRLDVGGGGDMVVMVQSGTRTSERRRTRDGRDCRIGGGVEAGKGVLAAD